MKHKSNFLFEGRMNCKSEKCKESLGLKVVVGLANLKTKLTILC